MLKALLTHRSINQAPIFQIIRTILLIAGGLAGNILVVLDEFRLSVYSY